ncbi:MAG: hypothetical protein AMXMBFR84_31870 [Candidatus Hydrogenedentota bacterium]
MSSMKTTMSPLRLDDIRDASDLSARWNDVDVLTLPFGGRSPYVVGFVCSDKALEETQRLRYEVFNVELGEGLASSELSGLDRDEYDDQMTHLVLVDPEENRIVGTYRLQAARHALRHRGLYAAQEYDLAQLEPYFDHLTELGRACLAQDHRTLPAIMQLWLGVGAFMNLHDQRYLFGCCSLTTQDPDDGWRAMKTIRMRHYLHEKLYLPALPSHSCGMASRENDTELGDPLPLPKLFRTYMRLGVQVISEPAIDREFRTVDFLVLLDGYEVQLSRLDILK